jgi:KUP system potassium uptake protein
VKRNRSSAALKSDSHSQRALLLGALGVVYGDIGTSPLYAFKECFFGTGEGHHAMPTTVPNIMGIVSLIFWSLMLVVVIKYLVFVMRANNHGEGGIMALMALVSPKAATSPSEHGLPSDCAFPTERIRPDATPARAHRLGAGKWMIWAGLFGAALLYGDGMITPAISVLGALEGLVVAAPGLETWIVPLTLGILIALFLFQKRGTAGVARIFGPTMLVWFLTIGAIGVPWVIRQPQVLLALNPLQAFEFFSANGWHSFLILSSVVLCITGAEALYADMGHFGVKAIRKAWYWIVFPALILNYLGQGAMVISRTAAGEQVQNPFFELVPSLLQYPLIALATLAAVIASQALISGAYSLTHQAIRLGFLPRIPVIHTSETTEGQIYVPKVNFILMVSCLALVLAFQSSTKLAAAYGIAVTGTMAITSLLIMSQNSHNRV